jgi:hypothetical protein
MFSTLKARLLCGLSVAGFAMSLTTGSAVPVQAATIDFNTRGELANNFIQGSQFSNSTNFYRQSKTGGITGGSVTGFSGPDYDATAVYQPLPRSFSSIGTNISFDGLLFQRCIQAPCPWRKRGTVVSARLSGQWKWHF